MRRAVELAGMCVTEPGRSEPSPLVGAVAIDDSGTFLVEAHRGARNPGDHAEYCVVEALRERPGALAGATVFTTLEPCTRRKPPKIPCAQRLIDEGVARVYIGMLDPDPAIRELGWKALRGAGIECRDFSAECRTELLSMNTPFIERFQVVTGPTGRIRFDYMQNGGAMRIQNGGAVFDTRWSMAGKGSIHAYGAVGSVAISREAVAFEDIDDPGVFEFKGHSKHVREGQLVIFKGPRGYAVVRIESVLAGPNRGDTHTEAVVSYELRLHD